MLLWYASAVVVLAGSLDGFKVALLTSGDVYLYFFWMDGGGACGLQKIPWRLAIDTLSPTKMMRTRLESCRHGILDVNNGILDVP